jgi:hypothetical protein
LEGPSRAVLRDFGLNGGAGDALLITNADQPGGRVFADQLSTSSDEANPPAYGIHVNGVESGDVSLMCTGMIGNRRNVVARGGPLRSTGKTAPGQVSLFTGATSSAGMLFDVDDGSVLLAEAFSNDGAWPDATHFDLDSSGSLTVTGLRISLEEDPASVMSAPLIHIHGHKGAFTMLTSSLIGQSGRPPLRFEIDGDGTDTKVLALGDMFWVNGTTAATVGDVWKDTSSPSAEAALVSSIQNGNIGFAPLPNVTAKTNVDASDAIIVEGLKVLRAARIDPPNARPPNVTDVKIFRVFARTGKDKTTVEIRR